MFLPRITFAALAAVLLLSGCGQRVAFTAANRASIRSASIVHRGDYPQREEIFVYTFAKNMSAALGGIAGAISSTVAAGDDRGALLAELRQNNIDPGLMVSRAFEQLYRQSPVVPLAAGGDARFEMDVKQIGLRIRHGYSTALSPSMMVEAKLIRRDGTVLWQETLSAFETDVRHPAEDYARDPQLLRNAYEVCARAIAQQAIESLNEDSR